MPATVSSWPNETARRNDASGARLLDGQWEDPFAKGTSRYVGHGVYTSGRRKHQPCVVKWLRGGHSRDPTAFAGDLDAVHRAHEIISSFNAARVIHQPVRINIPLLWVLGHQAGHQAGSRVLIEPFIDRFQKLNSNSGWTGAMGPDGAGWGAAMQALSHYSYHVSNGQELLCDLQGGFYRDFAVLTDPVICSRSVDYGYNDLGRRGIYNFFAHHECSEFCREEWRRPSRAIPSYYPVKSTTMRRATE